MRLLPSPFTASGEWLRGNLHLHSTNSDGSMPPDRLAAHYANAGWDFLAFTDHRKVTELPERITGGVPITLIRGTEANTGPRSTAAGTNFHIIGLGVQEPIAPNDDLTGARAAQWVVDAIREQGGEATIAHPYWSGLTLEEVAAVRGHLAIEVYNADTEVHIGRGVSSALWDDLLTRGIETWGIAVDDCHRPAHDSLRGWTVVRAADRSASAIIAALRAGHFYASCGPEIHDVSVEFWETATTDQGTPYTGRVLVRCSPVRTVSLMADPTKGGRINAGTFGMARNARRLRTRSGHGPEGIPDGELLTGSEFFLTGQERYVRVQVEDAQGRCAWTNPLFMRD